MNKYSISRALGIIEGISWVVSDSAVADALTTAVEMIDEAICEDDDDEAICEDDDDEAVPYIIVEGSINERSN